MQLAAAVAERVVQKLRHLRSQPVLAPGHTDMAASMGAPGSLLDELLSVENDWSALW